MNKYIFLFLTIFMTTACLADSVVAPRATQTTINVFAQRDVWKTFPSQFQHSLAQKLGTPTKAIEFAQFCERTGLLKSNIAARDLSEPVLAIGELAMTITAYGYKMAKIDRTQEARQAWKLALLLAPRHVSAWAGMAILSVNEQDCKSAIYWADQVLGYRPNLNSNDPIEDANTQIMFGQGEREAAAAFNNPGMIGNRNKVIIQMREIKAMCK
jgi:hypothetical protein